MRDWQNKAVRTFFKKHRLLNVGVLLLVFTFLLWIRIARKPAWVVVSDEFPAMGTVVEIQIVCLSNNIKAAGDALEAARDEISRLESLMSPNISTSDIYRINQKAASEPVEISAETFDVIKNALALSEKTDGAFDITFASVAKLWSLKPEAPRIPTDDEIAIKLHMVNYKNVILDEGNRTVKFAQEGMEIGLGGIAKATAVERAVNIIKERGYSDALVNAGGDIYAMGFNAKRKPWRIGIRHPRDNTKFLKEIDVSNIAVFTSGDYERVVEVDGKRYHHLFDPQTGKPAEKCISATVIAHDIKTVAGLSASVFILGPEKGLELIRTIPAADALIVTPDLAVHSTEFFQKYEGSIPEN
ncbi:MAG: Thiamine biosynthesis lipoprotein ApbE precursor [candidate division BRC1 bacterium ADurb.Bin183]|nr:MAG: Thiamine biosynthesis lipoprotein ApbE precursor [candidate division BRC1 bacterium ADurb.Bin183]